MTALEAIQDPTIKTACFEDGLDTTYEYDVLEDAWQEVCVYELQRATPPTFKTWKKARNYLTLALSNRAKNILTRKDATIVAETDEDVSGDESLLSLIPDTRPNTLEAWIESEDALIQQWQSEVVGAKVRGIISSLPESAREDFTLLLKTPKTLWKLALMRKHKFNPEGAQGRLDWLLGFAHRFESLRGARPRPSERSSTDLSRKTA